MLLRGSSQNLGHSSRLTAPSLLIIFNVQRTNCVVSDASPDPVGSITGHRLDAAALLHYHVYVGFHDLCDLSNLQMYRQKKKKT